MKDNISLRCNETVFDVDTPTCAKPSAVELHHGNYQKLGADLEATSSTNCRQHVLPVLDSTVFEDDRVLKNLLNTEERCLASPNYFICVQSQIKEHMRRELTDWMLDVADEERCDYDVFPLAVNYLDRFLSVEAVHKSQLQVLGTACLFLASKVKQPQPLCAKRLVEYSAKSVDLSELMSWELLVLNRLNWNLNSVTACDFVDHMMYKLRLPTLIEKKLRPHLQTNIGLIATEYHLAVLPPSVIAVSCLSVAFGRLLNDVTAASRMLAALQPILKAEVSLYEPYVETVWAFVDASLSDEGRIPQATNSSGNATSTSKCRRNETLAAAAQQQSTGGGGGTPTDICDVQFP